MRISPSLGAGAVGSDNLTYYTQDIGAIPAGQKIQITIDYQKSTDTLSAENLTGPAQRPHPPEYSFGSQPIHLACPGYWAF